jgi:pyruvate dehydrogenase (quinone)/pyruvate oxidase
MGDERTAAQAMIDLLVDGWGVRHIFGIPGDGINPIMEALRQRRNEVQFIQTRHEAAAAFAATAYAKLSGRLGVCLSTTGPGGTNLLTGLYDAKLDQVPVLAITGLQYHDLIGQWYQQDIDLDHLMSDVAVYSQRITSPTNVESITNIAVRSALSSRGVGHITMPVDIQNDPMSAAKVSTMSRPNHTSHAYSEPVVTPRADDIAAAAAVLNAGKKVVILIGSGAREARHEVEQIAEILGAPIAKAYLGKDVLPDDHPYVTGGIGVIGTKPTSDAMEGCDTILMIGTSFPYVRYLPNTDGSVRGVQIDRNPQRVGLRFPIEVGLVGDARETLAALLPHLQHKEDRSFLKGIQAGVREWRAAMETRESDPSLPVKPELLGRAIGESLADDAILLGDSGTTAMWISRDIGMREGQRFTVSGLLASMACALPYAIGAQTAFPDRQVVAFVGDGGLAMLLGDLATLTKYNLPVKVIVLKNNVLGMIRWEQLMWVGNPEYGIELQDIDFVKIAEGFGLTALHTENPDDVRETIALALRTPGPVLVEAVVDPYQPMMDGSVKPMQAEHVGKALANGEANVERVTRRVIEYAGSDVPANRETMLAGLRKTALAQMRTAEHATSDGQEPGTTFVEQRRTAPERGSGSSSGETR